MSLSAPLLKAAHNERAFTVVMLIFTLADTGASDKLPPITDPAQCMWKTDQLIPQDDERIPKPWSKQ